jgi:hypothetical protein
MMAVETAFALDNKKDIAWVGLKVERKDTLAAEWKEKLKAALMVDDMDAE